MFVKISVRMLILLPKNSKMTFLLNFQNRFRTEFVIEIFNSGLEKKCSKKGLNLILHRKFQEKIIQKLLRFQQSQFCENTN